MRCAFHNAHRYHPGSGSRMTLRLVVWNCAGGFEPKHTHLSNLRADVAIIPEVRSKDVKHLAPTAAWMGEEGKKGLLVLVRSDWTISPWPLDLPAATRHFLAATIRTPDEKAFDLLAVWAKRSEDYVRPTSEGHRSICLALHASDSNRRRRLQPKRLF